MRDLAEFRAKLGRTISWFREDNQVIWTYETAAELLFVGSPNPWFWLASKDPAVKVRPIKPLIR
jgi:hypothetical protein